MKKNPKGESFCWHAASGIGTFVKMYEATSDKSWLTYGVKYFDFLIDNLDTGPDGYKGWIGPYMYDKRYWCDVHVGDAILWGGILDFAVLVFENEALKADYGEKARLYTELAQKHCIEKWVSRGTWHEDGTIGAYVSFGKYLEPGDLSAWKYGSEIRGSNLSLPFNKQNGMAQICIRLYRITGSYIYFDRAEKIFNRMKKSFQYFDNHYVWNYWEPFGPWDIDCENNKPRHWINVHPDRIYFERVVIKNPPGFERKHVSGPVSVSPVEFTECPDLTMAVVIPQVISEDEKVLILCKSWSAADTLEIALYLEKGAHKIRTLCKTFLKGGGDGLSGIHIFSWDGTDPENKVTLKGDYRIRWTFGNGFRERPIILK